MAVNKMNESLGVDKTLKSCSNTCNARLHIVLNVKLEKLRAACETG